MFQISASVYSQKTTMSFTMTDKSVKEVLDYIQEKTEFRFFYNEDFTDLNRKVSLDLKETGIEDILDTLLSASDVTYKVLDNNLIVITPKSLVQQQIITGTVTDATTGEPLIGVTIMIEGTNRGVITDVKGHFSINATPGEILVISYIGMEAQKIPVGASTTLNVSLKASVKEIDEVVVIGYGTMRKADVTSAVTNVKKEDFLSGNIQDAAELIKGKVAGLTVTKGSGDPNAESTIRLRGITSMLGNITPLVLVDGIEGSLNSVAPENIESIDVLKDASAAAIYGTRGANGVIIITTKSGKRQEKTDVTYAAYATMSDFYKVADFMDPTDIIYGKTAMKDMGWDTDWLAAISQKGFTQNHSLSIIGGTDKTSYSTNFAYRQEKGTIKKTNNEEMKMQFDLNHWLFKDKVKLNFNLVKGIHKNDVTNAGDGGVNNIYRQAVIRNPTEPIYNVDNDPLLRRYYENWIFQYYNPVAMINEHMGEYKNEWTRITGNITLEPIPGWQNNLKLSTHRSNDNTESYTTSNYYTWHTAGREGEAYKSSSNSLLNQLEFTSRFEKIIRTHHRLSVLAGYSYQYDKYESFAASNYGFYNDNYKYNNLGGGTALTNKDNPDAYMGSNANDSKLIGFFGRISYGFKDKYNILASVRHEGSSKFGANHKWGTFPAVSAGWTISKESFMNSLDFVSNLKLRVGYGVTGIIAGNNYESLVRWNYNTTSWGYFLNSKGQWAPSLEAVNNPNPDLKWEKSGEFNLGVDFGFLNDRITGSVDYYDKTSSDLLYNYSVPSPPNFFTSTYANAGKMKNQGFEVTIKAIPFKSPKFQYVTSITAYHNKNKVVSLSNDMYETKNYQDNGWAGDPVSLPTQRLEIGSHFGRYYSLKTKGLSENGLWMVQNPLSGKYEEFTAAMATSESTYRQWLGTSAIPKIYLNWDNTVRYMNFDLNIQMSSQLGFEIVNEQRMFYENNSIAYNRLESAADPIPIVDENGKKTGKSRLMSTAQSQTIVDWYYENGNFVKIDYVTLGYNFNISKLNYVDNFRIYLSGENLLCITKYKGLDPEMSNADIYSLGIDGRDKYPTIRSFTFGLNINFK
jgi:TonB-linked SusC/RagA family outer membrane protein